MSVILSNDKPLVNYTTTRTTSLLDMIISLFRPKQQKLIAVAQYSDAYLDLSLKIGHLPEYGYPVYCAWCGELVHNNGQTPDTSGICASCKKEMEDQI